MSDDDALAKLALDKLAIARHEGASPVGRAIVGLFLAQLELLRDMLKTREPPTAHERAVVRARITAEFNRFRAIPDCRSCHRCSLLPAGPPSSFSIASHAEYLRLALSK